MLVHRAMHASPETFLKALAPSRAAIVVAVACLLTWDWRAALGAHAGLPGVRGHALSRKALQGGQATNDRMDARNIAVLLRGGLLPQASGSPAALRVPRARLRRRLPLTRKRAALLPPIPQTNRQYTLPELGQQLASTANRDGGAARLPEPAGPTSVAVDRALSDFYDQRRREIAWTIGQTAQPHDTQTLSRLPSIPGIGTMLR